MEVKQFRYGADNLAYLVWQEKVAMAVDGGAVAAMVAFCRRRGLELRYVTNTHRHGDHTCGNQGLVAATGARLHSGASLAARGGIMLGDKEVRVLPTPGHTSDSVCFLAGNTLLSGDTLFNGTVGNCFSGDFLAFFASITRLMELPATTRVYAGHDYVHESLAFARRLEPDNPAIPRYLAEEYRPQDVVSTLAWERRINPFLRFDEDSLRQLLADQGLPCATPYERWHSLMQLE